MDYGLWLLVGLLVIIGLVFLLSGKKKSGIDMPVEPIAPPAPQPLVDSVPETPVVAQPPVAPAVVAPIAPAPVPVAPVPVAPVPVAIAPEPEPVAAPTPAPAPAPVAPASEVDDLLKLKGVGPKLKTLLIELGVTRYAQIAAWSDADIATIDAKLGNFKGRPVRDQWVDQAKYLVAGDTAGFEAKYGKL